MLVTRESPRHAVVVTGMGWVTPLGHDLDTAWRRLLAGESGAAELSRFDPTGFPVRIAAEVKAFRLADHLHPTARQDAASVHTQFALAACAQAWRAAGLDRTRPDPTRVGVYLGSGEGPLDLDAYAACALAARRDGRLDHASWARAALVAMNATRELEQEPSTAVAHLASLVGARGPSLDSLSACAASAQAIGEACAVLRRGEADVIVAGGAHSMLHPLGLTGFVRLTALSRRNDEPSRASRPFDAARAGFVLGEGAGIAILETEAHARARGAPVLAEVVGFGSTADAYRITDQHPQGRGAIEAMRRALADARLSPGDVDYVNAHGTGTRENDGTETAAIKAVFGPRPPPVSSIKSMLGHLIAAAGAVELIACVLAIRDGVLPPTINLEEPDPACDLDYVAGTARRAKCDVALSNSFGFGGQNDSLIVRRCEP